MTIDSPECKNKNVYRVLINYHREIYRIFHFNRNSWKKFESLSRLSYIIRLLLSYTIQNIHILLHIISHETKYTVREKRKWYIFFLFNEDSAYNYNRCIMYVYHLFVCYNRSIMFIICLYLRKLQSSRNYLDNRFLEKEKLRPTASRQSRRVYVAWHDRQCPHSS